MTAPEDRPQEEDCSGVGVDWLFLFRFVTFRSVATLSATFSYLTTTPYVPVLIDSIILSTPLFHITRQQGKQRRKREREKKKRTD